MINKVIHRLIKYLTMFPYACEDNNKSIYASTFAENYQIMSGIEIGDCEVFYDHDTKFEGHPDLCTVIVPNLKERKGLIRGILPIAHNEACVNFLDKDLVVNGFKKSNIRDYIYSIHALCNSYVEYTLPMGDIYKCRNSPYFASIRMIPSFVSLLHMIEICPEDIDVDNTFTNIIARDIGLYSDEASQVVENIRTNAVSIIPSSEYLYSYMTLSNLYGADRLKVFYHG